MFNKPFTRYSRNVIIVGEGGILLIIYLQMIAGDENKQRFAVLYETYRGLMFHVANKLMQNAYDAEDAVHQAFVSLAENFSKIDEIECPQTRSYIVLIVERKAIDILRKHNRQAEVSINEAVLGIEISLPSDHGLADAMADLPTHYREILLLRYYNGYTAKEIAAALGISYAAMKKQLTRAKNALRVKTEEGDMSNGNEYNLRRT